MAVDPLCDAIARLTIHQREYVGRIIGALTIPVAIQRSADSDFASVEFVELMADVLRGHHVSSTKPLGKEHFEHAIASVLVDLDYAAQLSPMGYPGADLTVNGQPWSLKTQGDQNIKPDVIHISKFMELGKGRWHDEADLAALRDAMLLHMEGYERIFTMRYLTGAKARRGTSDHEYELVEIPTSVLKRATGVECVMMHDSKQMPKPGYCRVVDDAGDLMFELYFDGGTERKLQVRKLRVDLCVVHARWSFAHAA